MFLGKPHRLQPESQRHTLLVGLTAIAASAVLTRAGTEIGFVGSKVVAEAAIAACLLWFYIEPSRAPFTLKLIATLISAGIALGAIWIAFFAPDKHQGGFIDWKAHPLIFIAAGYVNVTLTAPLFEEKVVRGLIFSGLSKYINSTLSSVVVSMLFAVAHSGSMVWAFIVSLVLCWMMLKYRLDSYQRAIVHGILNFMSMTWYFLN
jgi:membrane protease YdiL (CAAX protease family)